MFGLPGNLTDLLKQAQDIQKNMAKLQEEAAKTEVEASAGGGVVTARVNGKFELLSLRIDPSVVNPSDIEMLQDLVQAAVNEALRQVKSSLKEEVSKLTGGLPIPGFGF